MCLCSILQISLCFWDNIGYEIIIKNDIHGSERERSYTYSLVEAENLGCLLMPHHLLWYHSHHTLPTTDMVKQTHYGTHAESSSVSQSSGELEIYAI